MFFVADKKRREALVSWHSTIHDCSAKLIERCLMVESILQFITSDVYLFESLAMKGGIALNFCYLNVPRLSNDIDFDYCKNTGFDNLEDERETIIQRFEKMAAHRDDVFFSVASKGFFDSIIYEYVNVEGVKESICIDINYLKRVHILGYTNLLVNNRIVKGLPVKTLDLAEVIGGKIKILLEYRRSKDFYDIYNIYSNNLASDKNLIKKCVIYYNTISGNCDIDRIDFRNLLIDELSLEELRNMLPSDTEIDFPSVADKVRAFVKDTLSIDDSDRKFISDYRNHVYNPSLLFQDQSIAEKLLHHPMAIPSI